jgi:hypothetical protein
LYTVWGKNTIELSETEVSGQFIKRFYERNCDFAYIASKKTCLACAIDHAGKKPQGLYKIAASTAGFFSVIRTIVRLLQNSSFATATA